MSKPSRLAAQLEAKTALIATLTARAEAADARAAAAGDVSAAVARAWDALEADIAWTVARAGGLADGAPPPPRAPTPPHGADGDVPDDPLLSRLLARCPLEGGDAKTAAAAREAEADVSTAADRRLAARAAATRAALADALAKADAALPPGDAGAEVAAARARRRMQRAAPRARGRCGPPGGDRQAGRGGGGCGATESRPGGCGGPAGGQPGA